MDLSVIACTVDEEYITIVADSAVTYNECQQLTDPDSKLFVQGDYVIGGVGDIEVVTLWKPYLHASSSIVHRKSGAWMNDYDDPIFAMYDLLRDYGDYLGRLGHALYDTQTGYSGQFFIVTLPHVWEVSGMYIREITDIAIIGAAEASVRVGLDLGASPEVAVAVACKYNTLCSMPLKKITISRTTGELWTQYIETMDDLVAEAA